MTELMFDENAKHCAMCADTGAVNVIPHGGGPNDSREDECPWCLRREIARNRLAEEKAATVLRAAKDAAHNGWKRALEPMIDEALRLLEGR
ncbi:MAG: hypothetical protein WC565_05490 [Parcubacteria group bacterium]|jgi:hypothetical protein